MNAVWIAVLAVLVASAAFVIVQRQAGATVPLIGARGNSNKQSTFIICGPSNSGKTALFHWLTQHELVSTVMSQQQNVTTKYMLPSTGSGIQSFQLVEFPGHHKLRAALYEGIKQSTNVHGLVFCVDSTTDPRQLSEAAKFLYQVLTLTERRPGGVDVLVACTKNESFSARQPKKIKEVMQHEIDLYRRFQSANVVKNDEDAEDEIELATPTGKFLFDQLDGNVDFIGGSVLKGTTDPWECWIDERAVNF